MRIIISPAKKINTCTDFCYEQLPYFIKDTETIFSHLKKLRYEQLKRIWNCSDKLASLNYERINNMRLYDNLNPAIFAFKGIQYQYMAPSVFNESELNYIQKHLRILSGFYGMLRPLDGIVPYRLEMQAKLKGNNYNSLYDFWNTKIANQLFSESNLIVNLASKEYSKSISTYLNDHVQWITCVFGDKVSNKVVEKGTLVKMARGEMVRFMAENNITDVEGMKRFNRLNYIFDDQLSNENTLVFIKRE